MLTAIKSDIFKEYSAKEEKEERFQKTMRYLSRSNISPIGLYGERRNDETELDIVLTTL